MAGKPLRMTRVDRVAGITLMLLLALMAAVGCVMAAVGWSSVCSGAITPLIVFGAGGPVVVIAASLTAAWIGRDVIRGEWR